MTEPRLTVEPEFQYSSLFEQAQTAVAGMWLFLAQESIFFGGMILTWVYARYWNMAGFDAGASHTVLWIGSVNAGVLITSSFVFACALLFARAGQPRLTSLALIGVMVLGCVFLMLKGYEWHLDFESHNWVNDPDFPVKGELEGGAKLFWAFYWIGTVLHAAHMTVGIGLVAYVLRRSLRREFTPLYYTPVEVVGIFWSYVDVIWLLLWPLIYLIGRSP